MTPALGFTPPLSKNPLLMSTPSEHYAAILSSYADKRIGRPELLATLADYERLRAVYAIARTRRVPVLHKDVSELLRMGGGPAWVDLVHALREQAESARESRSEGGYIRARVRLAAETIAPATGFYEAIDTWMTQGVAAVLKHDLPAVLVGVPFDPSQRDASLAFSAEAAATGLPNLVGRLLVLENEAAEIIKELLPVEQADDVISLLDKQRDARLSGDIDSEDKSLGWLCQLHLMRPISGRMRGARVVRIADLCAGRAYIDRQGFLQRSVAAPATIDACIEALEQADRIQRLPASIGGHSGAGFYTDTLHMRRAVFYQDQALKAITRSIPESVLHLVARATEPAVPAEHPLPAPDSQTPPPASSLGR